MKKYFLLLFTVFATIMASAQSRGIKIAYIDMEYILDKVPDYAEAKSQLEQKANKWKQEIEVKKNDIAKLRESLNVEKALLTKELIEEREEEITYLENELLEYQDKRFGPKGDLISQKSVLVKPIQDQVFTIVQELAEVRNYDFVFDKSSDLTMMFSAKRHDISDHVVRRLTRAAKREQLSSREVKKLEEQEAQEDLAEDPEYAERQKKLEDRKAERQRILDERKAARDAKVQAAAERREQIKQEREAKQNRTTPKTTNDVNTEDDSDTPANTNRPADTTPANNVDTTDEPIQGENKTEVKTTATEVPEEGTPSSVDRQTAAQAAQEERARKIEERKRVIEERKQKILADREAAKRAREEQKNNGEK